MLWYRWFHKYKKIHLLQVKKKMVLHGDLNELNPRLPKWSHFSMYVFTLNLRPLRLMCCLPPEPLCSSAVGTATRKGPRSRVKTASADHPQTAPRVVAVGGTRSTGSAPPSPACSPTTRPPLPPTSPPHPWGPGSDQIRSCVTAKPKVWRHQGEGWYSNTPWKW